MSSFIQCCFTSDKKKIAHDACESLNFVFDVLHLAPSPLRCLCHSSRPRQRLPTFETVSFWLRFDTFFVHVRWVRNQSTPAPWGHNFHPISLESVLLGRCFINMDGKIGPDKSSNFFLEPELKEAVPF